MIIVAAAARADGTWAVELTGLRTRDAADYWAAQVNILLAGLGCQSDQHVWAVAHPAPLPDDLRCVCGQVTWGERRQRH